MNRERGKYGKRKTEIEGKAEIEGIAEIEENRESRQRSRNFRYWSRLNSLPVFTKFVHSSILINPTHTEGSRENEQRTRKAESEEKSIERRKNNAYESRNRSSRRFVLSLSYIHISVSSIKLYTTSRALRCSHKGLAYDATQASQPAGQTRRKTFGEVLIDTLWNARTANQRNNNVSQRNKEITTFPTNQLQVIQAGNSSEGFRFLWDVRSSASLYLLHYLLRSSHFYLDRLYFHRLAILPIHQPPLLHTRDSASDSDSNGWQDMPIVYTDSLRGELDEEDQRRYHYLGNEHVPQHQHAFTTGSHCTRLRHVEEDWEESSSSTSRYLCHDHYALKEERVADDDRRAMTPLSQMQQTKGLLSKSQQIAYVGLCAVVMQEMTSKVSVEETRRVKTEWSYSPGDLSVPEHITLDMQYTLLTHLFLILIADTALVLSSSASVPITPSPGGTSSYSG
ncbi:hypothetical protein F5876DRAFT_64926 [Lentinula aff. lateritia]|uniref:Uncharacterized protein n=1 Tax=Lentinula aff. lateritia TaxID=2804960 RepID=A0ACC1U2H4_9AGAR|nr:hypothetical protein F5876DRAFT_64926 [Lentinula aff. lateritia]